MKKLLSLIFAVLMVTALMTSVAIPTAATETNGVTERISTLVTLLEGKHFTVTGKACTCSDAACSNCSVTNVIACDWFEDMFGYTLNQAQLPEQYRPLYNGGGWGSKGGYSCYGFANFAFWYIFAESATSYAQYECAVTDVYFTYDTVSTYAKPGDILRYEGSDGRKHSMIYVSCTESKIKVLDCNFWGTDLIELHEFEWGTRTACKLAITRATNYSEIENKVDKIVDSLATRINNLIVKLEGKYFTYDGSACENSGYCGNSADCCYNTDVMSATWFKNLLGSDIINSFPTSGYNHFYPGSSKSSPGGYQLGSSCHGFATFAFWYIFGYNQDTPTSFGMDYVVTTAVDSTAKFNSETLKKYAKPGDLIRITRADGTGGHSFIFLGCKDDHVSVLDCNWDTYCSVSEHDIYFSDTKWANGNIGITRASNWEDVFNSIQSNPEYKTQYKYHSYPYINSEEKQKYSVCGGASNKSYDETDWLDERLPVDTSEYNYFVHVRGSSCSTYICKDVNTPYMYKHIGNDEWPGGWYYEETRFVPVEKYTVTFNANGGTTPTASKTVTADATYGTLPTPTRTGYTFDGWYTAASGGTKITASTIVSIVSNHTLYAHWTANKYTITFNADGGTTPTASKTVTYDSTYGTLPTPTNPGYTFAGWYTSAGTLITASSTVKIDYNAVLTARWNEIPITSLSFDKSSYELTVGEEITVLLTVNPISAEAFNITAGNELFDCVFVSSESVNNTQVFKFKLTAKAAGTGDIIANTVSLSTYAISNVTIKNKAYTVTYNANGGTGAPAAQTKTFGTDLTLSSTKPTRTGYTFRGWATSSTGTVAYAPGDVFIYNANTTLYAVWTANAYTVTLDPNIDGEGSIKGTVIFGYDYGDFVANWTREGYEFDGWYTAETGGTKITTDTIVSIASNHTLYAHWTLIAVTDLYFDETSLEMTVGENWALWLYVEPKNAGGEITYSSTVPYEVEYLKDDGNAKVYQITLSPTAAGTSTFKATLQGKTASCALSVKDANIPVTGVSLDRTSVTLTEGNSITLAATVAPSNATVKGITWSSSDESVADVNSDGHVTAKAAGTATITVKTTDGNKTASCKITVNKTVDENSPAITVASVSGRAGNTVDVTISIKNNPGIISMLLDVTYDSKYLTLAEVKNGDILNGATHDVTLLNANPYTLSWADDTAQDNNTSNGMIVTLKFKIAENAPVGSLPITVTYDNSNAAIYDKDMQLVDFDIVNGAVEVKDYLIGDLNDDGKVNSFDRTILARYIAKWDGYKASDFVYEAADVNNDGNVNAFDRTILARHISKWIEYSVLPYIK